MEAEPASAEAAVAEVPGAAIEPEKRTEREQAREAEPVAEAEQGFRVASCWDP